MNIFYILILFLLLSFLFAVREYNKEKMTVEKVRKIKIKRKKTLTGVILFMKKKIAHYSSLSS